MSLMSLCVGHFISLPEMVTTYESALFNTFLKAMLICGPKFFFLLYKRVTYIDIFFQYIPWLSDIVMNN